jgi:hypothetical protein
MLLPMAPQGSSNMEVMLNQRYKWISKFGTGSNMIEKEPWNYNRC